MCYGTISKNCHVLYIYAFYTVLYTLVQVKHSIHMHSVTMFHRLDCGQSVNITLRFENSKKVMCSPKSGSNQSHVIKVQVTIQSHTKHQHLSLHHLVAVSREPLEQFLCARNVYSFHEPLPWSRHLAKRF